MQVLRKLPILVLLLAIPALPSHASRLDSYLSDRLDTAVRVQVSLEHTRDTSFLETLLSLIGVRSIVRARPVIGTTYVVQSSAYASSPYQTDATPCITSAGTLVRPGVVASNFLPLGTILSMSGDYFIVEDRMNARYRGSYIDVWFPSTSEALAFGRREITVTVVGFGKPGEDVRDRDAIGERIRVEDLDERSFWDTVQTGFAAFGHLISAQRPRDVNKFDVDCLSKEQN